MNRSTALKSYKSHAWFSRIYKKLRRSEIDFCFDFIEKNDALSVGDFEKAVNRVFLEQTKPKGWTIILELLTCANSAFAEDQ